jgi:hypothetical protein
MTGGGDGTGSGRDGAGGRSVVVAGLTAASASLASAEGRQLWEISWYKPKKRGAVVHFSHHGRARGSGVLFVAAHVSMAGAKAGIQSVFCTL